MAAKKIIILFFITIFAIKSSYASDSLTLKIEVVKIYQEKLTCNFIYYISIQNKKNTIKTIKTTLPFGLNPNMKFTSSARVSYSFENNRGLMRIETYEDSSELIFEYTNVEIPLEQTQNKDEYKATFNFSNAISSEEEKHQILSLKEFEICNIILLESNPKFISSGKNKCYIIKSDNRLSENVFVIFQNNQNGESVIDFAISFIIFIISIITSLNIFKSKRGCILGLSSGILILVILSYLTISKTFDILHATHYLGSSLGLLLGSAYRIKLINYSNNQKQ